MGLSIGRETEYIVKYTNEALQLLPDVMLELVRCKDCKHFQPDRFGERGFCNFLDIVCTTTWYCADGEKKEESET